MAYIDDIGNAPGQAYDWAKRQFISLTKPSEDDGDYTTRSAAIARQQKRAEALSTMGEQEQGVYTAGGITAPVSPMGALARGLTSFGGAYLSGKAAADEAALKKAQEAETSDTIAKAIKAGGAQYSLAPVEKSALPDIPGAATSTGGITPMPAGGNAAPPSSYDANAALGNMPSAFAAPRQSLGNDYTGISGQSYTPGSRAQMAQILAASKIPALREIGLQQMFEKPEKMSPGDVLMDSSGRQIGSRVPMRPVTKVFPDGLGGFLEETTDANGSVTYKMLNPDEIAGNAGQSSGNSAPPVIDTPDQGVNYPNSPVIVDSKTHNVHSNPYYKGSK